MGKIGQTVFGGSKSKTSNKAYDGINQAFSPLYGQAATGANSLQRLLSGDSTGLDAYKDSTGFDWAAETGSRGITGNQAANGVLRSGGTGRRLVEFGEGLQNQYAQSYMDRLLQQAGLGFSAAGATTGAGGTSKSSEKPGLAKFIGQAMSGGMGG
jgi:hypothetical protein